MSVTVIEDGGTVEIVQSNDVVEVIDQSYTMEVETNAVIIDGPAYNGPYEVTPTTNEQTLATRQKLMTNDVTVHQVPMYEVSNQYGTTCYIAIDA